MNNKSHTSSSRSFRSNNIGRIFDDDEDNEVTYSELDFDHVYNDDEDDIQDMRRKPTKKNNRVKSADSDDEDANIMPEKQKIIAKKSQDGRQNRDQPMVFVVQQQRLKRMQQASQVSHVQQAQLLPLAQQPNFSIARDLGLVYTRNTIHDLYYTMLSNTQSNIMYFIRIPLNYKINGVVYQLIKIGYTDDLKQRMQDIRQSLEYYIRSQRAGDDVHEIVLQPLFISTVKSLQCEKRLHDILKYYDQFCLSKEQKKALNNVSGFTEIYFFSESLVKTFESYVSASGYPYTKSQGLIDEMIAF